MCIYIHIVDIVEHGQYTGSCLGRALSRMRETYFTLHLAELLTLTGGTRFSLHFWLSTCLLNVLSCPFFLFPSMSKYAFFPASFPFPFPFGFFFCFLSSLIFLCCFPFLSSSFSVFLVLSSFSCPFLFCFSYTLAYFPALFHFLLPMYSVFLPIPLFFQLLSFSYPISRLLNLLCLRYHL